MTLSEQADANSIPGQIPLSGGHSAAITHSLSVICHRFGSAGRCQRPWTGSTFTIEKPVSPVGHAMLRNDNRSGSAYKASKIHSARITLIYDR